jgi:hypothetical protein
VENKSELCHPIATRSFAERRINGCCGLAVVGMKHVGVDRKRDVRFGMPKSPGDSDELARYRSLAQWVAGVAHEIHTPLGTINTATSVVEGRLNAAVFGC